MSIRSATPLAKLGGGTVVTLRLNGAKSSATCSQMRVIVVSSPSLKVVGSPSWSKAGMVMLLYEPHDET
jgi:hypothetical protein